MATRSARWRGLGLTVEVSDRIIERLQNRGRSPEPADVPPLDGHHLLMGDVPELDVTKHHVDEAISFFHNPDHDAERTGLIPSAHRIPLDQAKLLTDDLAEAEEIASVVWYHCIDFPHGVVTPGEFDHRGLVQHYHLPDDLSGKTALDIATNNGFWAFEFERLGAEVSAIDVTWLSELDLPAGASERIAELGVDAPVGNGFAVAKRVLDSSVDKIISNIYDLGPDSTGTFDFVHIADVLLHLKEPLRALERVRSVTCERAHIVDVFHPDIASGQTEYLGGWEGVRWWRPSLDTLAQMVLDAGFADVEVLGTYNITLNGRRGLWRAILSATT